jgi:hypothetical protein
MEHPTMVQDTFLDENEIIFFIGTCTTVALQFFTNAPQISEQMNMSLKIRRVSRN